MRRDVALACGAEWARPLLAHLGKSCTSTCFGLSCFLLTVLTDSVYHLLLCDAGQQANSVLELMFYELFWTSKCRTLDPEAADWFFMPLATQTIYLYRCVDKVLVTCIYYLPRRATGHLLCAN